MAIPSRDEAVRILVELKTPDWLSTHSAAVAEVAAFLAEMEGSYLLGQILFIDGGTEALLRPTAV